MVMMALISPACLRAQSPGYGHFEGRQTHPIRLSADGNRLFALNTPAGRLSVFDVSSPLAPPLLVAEIPVGLEPVSLAERTSDEVWVVNEVSDSISVVSISRRVAIAHLKTGDEPADIVFAGGHAFVSCAQDNMIRVFEAVTRQFTIDIQVNMLFPRALCAAEDGSKIYAAALLSGNKSTILPADLAPDPPTPSNTALPPAPKTGLIVHSDDARIAYDVLDHDVVEIDVSTLSVERYLSGVGTNIFDLIVEPGGGGLWAANTEALNLIRFEPALRGHFVDNRVTRIDLATGVATPYDLNAGLDYNLLPNPAAQVTAIAQPKGIVFDGGDIWVAGFGTDIVAKVDGATGGVLQRTDVGPVLNPGETSRSREKRAPRGLALDASNGRLFVLNRFWNSVSVIDTGSGVVAHEVMTGAYDPTPLAVREGRGFLFDARLSGNGTNSCASCHLDADRDGLAWDLGDPGGVMTYVEGENRVNHDTSGNDKPPVKEMRALHPMKGPKVTQTLRGMITRPLVVADTSAVGGVSTRQPLFHWRGDKISLDEFNGTFNKLMGGTEIPAADFAQMVTYLETLRLHPNPYRNLDRSLPADVGGYDPVAGRANFLDHGLGHCIVCHPLPSGTDQNIDEFNNASTVDFIKTPPIMLSYQKQGIFNPSGSTSLSGFGFGHDGTGKSLPLPHFYFLSTMNVQQLLDTRAFMLAFDSTSNGTAPVVGHTYTVTAENASDPITLTTLDTLRARTNPAQAALNRYWNDAVATGVIGGKARAYFFDNALNLWLPDSAKLTPMTQTQLLASLSGNDVLTFQGVPAELGPLLSIDRNGNNIPDSDEALPLLSIWQTGAQIGIDWTGANTGFFLEANDELTLPNWKPVPMTSLPYLLEPSGAEFFRLQRTW